MNCLRFDCHVVLVSDQPTPNLTPALDPDLRPNRMLLVVSADKVEQADWLTAALGQELAVERWSIGDAWDVEAIRERMLELVAEHDGQSLALNVTGGTKPMAIAAYEAFRAAGLPIFYVHPETDHLIWMHHPECPPSRDLADRVKLERFLLAHGVRVTQRGSDFGVPNELKDLNDALIQAIDAYQAPLTTLNFAAKTAQNTLVSEEIVQASFESPAFQALLHHFEDAGCLQIDGRRLVFADENARFLANGGWLETHVWGVCLSLKKATGIQDIGRSLSVERQTQGADPVPNELDIALLANNHLRLIECKTSKFDAAISGTVSKGAATVYKLDALTDLMGGLQAKAMLVSYRLLDKPSLDRAAASRIAVCHGGELKNLRDHLEPWIISG